MAPFLFTFKWIYYWAPKEELPALPEGIRRSWVPTAGGDIEVLSAHPATPTSKPPIFFAHGGMTGAWVWTEYMQYMAKQGVPSYAVSLRGHGSSWKPSYLRMVYTTTRRMLADDLVAALKWVEKQEGSEVVLVGHSSGGGLSQFVLSEKDVRVRGLALLGAVPGFGSRDVYKNWATFDPWSAFRMLLHGWHPNSPLSHPLLTKKAFFSDGISESYLLNFQNRICPYESFLWPISMMKPFVNFQTAVGQIGGWETGRERVLVMSGSRDEMMTMPIMVRLASSFRSAFVGLVEAKKMEAKRKEVALLDRNGGLDTAGQGVRFCLVPGAGHHLQNDVMWEIGAKKLLEFYEQL